ncbi:MAG: hypothetical protein ACRDHP_01320 [Ktedonobacterales bacterium]
MSRQTDLRTLSAVMSLARVGLGLAFVAAPGPLLRGWMGAREAASGPATMLARGLGVRDALLGLGGCLSLLSDESPRRWLRMGAVADAADVALTLAIRPGPSLPVRLLIAGTAAGGAVTFGWLSLLME